MSYLFTSESVSEGHPDKIADQISDAILDNFLVFDKNAKVACETLVTTGQVVLAGEVTSKIYVDVASVARETIRKVGYTKSEYMFDADSCGILSSIHSQSEDIRIGVEKKNKKEQGAGDQGMMFGYAVDETENYIPLTLDIAHKILVELSKIRKEGKVMKYLRPDAKSQVTIEYGDENKPKRIHTIVVSTQHDDFDIEKKMQEKIKKDILTYIIPKIKNDYKKLPNLFDSKIIYHINPTGKFVVGGPHGDTGLTGRKIIMDTYGGRGAHGGGAFSGKDPSKVDRSGAYAMRHIAKNLVASGVCNEALVQVSYAIGLKEPISLNIKTFGTNKTKYTETEIAQKISQIIDLTPFGIEKRLKLRNPIYFETASYGHMGRKNEFVTKIFTNSEGKKVIKKVELFTWEKLDLVNRFKKEFGL